MVNDIKLKSFGVKYINGGLARLIGFGIGGHKEKTL